VKGKYNAASLEIWLVGIQHIQGWSMMIFPGLSQPWASLQSPVEVGAATGQILLSPPMGCYENYGWQRVSTV
jgi:hypothetical protein